MIHELTALGVSKYQIMPCLGRLQTILTILAWYQGEKDERPAGAEKERRVALVRVAAVDVLLVLPPLALLLVRTLPVHLPV